MIVVAIMIVIVFIIVLVGVFVGRKTVERDRDTDRENEQLLLGYVSVAVKYCQPIEISVRLAACHNFHIPQWNE